MVLHYLDDGIPQAHTAAESWVSQPTVATWVVLYLESAEAGLTVRISFAA